MGVLSRAFGMRAAADEVDPADEKWWGSGGTVRHESEAGPWVTPETAMRVSTVFACVRVLSTMVASLPLPVLRRLANGGFEEARSHPLYRVLHDQPNNQQTSFDWRAMEQAHLMLRGNGYNLIVPGRRGFADQIVPLHPDRILPEYNAGDGRWMPAETAAMTGSGRMRYVQLRGPDGQSTPRELPEEDVFHIKGPFSINGLVGVSVLYYMADAVGLARAAESFGARFYRDGVGGKIFVMHPGELDDEGEKRLRKTLNETLGGLSNMHKVGLLEEGMKAERLGLTQEDAQFLESRAFQVEDLLRFMGIPGVLVGHPDKTATFASAEAFFMSFITHTMGPWLTNWEQAISKDLILAEDAYYVDFVEDDLLKGDSAARSAFYRVMVELGIFTRNEVRKLEKRNPLPGLDEPLTPKNMGGAEPAPSPPGAPKPAPPPGDDEDEQDTERQEERREQRRQRNRERSSRRQRIVDKAAARLVRKEMAAIQKWAPRYASDPAGWSRWVETFYAKHKDLVLDTLCLEEGVAAAYAQEQQAALLQAGVSVVETWPDTRAAQLARLASEGA
jgi:HK97 family phage portal protein